jgi:antirestriction protein ArdC
MHAHSSPRQRNADSQTAMGVPPMPPEDSPKADALPDTRQDATQDRKQEGRPSGRMDVRQVVTDRIIAMLERGGNVFRERWTRAASRGVPVNGKTGQPYHGANVLLLWDAAIEHGYASNVWLTYKQAEELGAHVRKGERSVMCAYFQRQQSKGGTMGATSDDRNTSAMNNTADGEQNGSEEGASRTGYLMCRPFWLFNVAQIDGLPMSVVDMCVDPPMAPNGPIEGAFRLLVGCNVTLRYGFERAMYLPALDEIRLPWPRRFTSPGALCATALHETVHWTGADGRLNRQFGQRFGDAVYAFEELVAELGSAFLIGHCGLIEATVEGHAAYLDAWLQVLKNDRTAIFTAARHASAAYEYILARGLPVLPNLRDEQ